MRCINNTLSHNFQGSKKEKSLFKTVHCCKVQLMDTSGVLVCVLMLVGIDISISGTRYSHFKARRTEWTVPSPHSVARIERPCIFSCPALTQWLV